MIFINLAMIIMIMNLNINYLEEDKGMFYIYVIIYI